LCLLICTTDLSYSLGKESSVGAFEEYKEFFGKTYPTKEAELKAFKNYLRSHKRVVAKNADQNETVHGLTKFADMSPAEFKARILMKTLHANYERKVKRDEEQNPTQSV
jgi:hypothetical protein